MLVLSRFYMPDLIAPHKLVIVCLLRERLVGGDLSSTRTTQEGSALFSNWRLSGVSRPVLSVIIRKTGKLQRPDHLVMNQVLM